MTRIVGGRTVYGYGLGILMLDTRFPRPVGDVGNALTWPFPVRYRIVTDATTRRVVRDVDRPLLDAFIGAARELEVEGVPAITTSCGFLALVQRDLAAAVRIPVLASSLLQVPHAARLIGPGRCVGIVTMSRDDLTEAHFAGVGWSSRDIPVVVAGFAPTTMFSRSYLGDQPEADAETLESELVDLCRDLIRDSPDVGAFVLECTNLVPYSQAVRRATGLPVFDLYTLVMQAHLAVTGTSFERPMRA